MAATYAYAQMETACAAALGLGLMQQRSVLRARIKHLMKVGLLSVERGRPRAHYTRNQFNQLLVSLVLTELGGMDPVVVTATVKNQWPVVAGSIELVGSYEVRSQPPYYLCVWSQTMTGPWLRKRALSINVLQLTASQLLQLMDRTEDCWFAAYNLTRIFTRAEYALPARS
jgi:hypothetical protein